MRNLNQMGRFLACAILGVPSLATAIWSDTLYCTSRKEATGRQGSANSLLLPNSERDMLAH